MTGYVSGVTRQYRAGASDYVYAETGDPDLPNPNLVVTPPAAAGDTQTQVQAPQNEVLQKASKKAKKNKTYYYRICAYVKDGGKKLKGKYAKAVRVRL